MRLSHPEIHGGQWLTPISPDHAVMYQELFGLKYNPIALAQVFEQLFQVVGDENRLVRSILVLAARENGPGQIPKNPNFPLTSPLKDHQLSVLQEFATSCGAPVKLSQSINRDQGGNLRAQLTLSNHLESYSLGA